MRRPFHAAMVALVLVGCSGGVPAPPDSGPLPADAPPPTFASYPAAAERFTGTPAEPDFSTLPGARLFRTAIRRGAAEGTNFAGAQTVVTWGCGTECQQFVIVDAATGAITDGFTTRWGVANRLDSDLLIVNPRPTDLPADVAPGQRTAYYRWSGAALELLGSR